MKLELHIKTPYSIQFQTIYKQATGGNIIKAIPQHGHNPKTKTRNRMIERLNESNDIDSKLYKTDNANNITEPQLILDS